MLPNTFSPPLLTFSGSDDHSRIKATNAAGHEIASFTVSGKQNDFTISRNEKLNTAPFCTSHKSQLTGYYKMTIHGHSGTLKPSSTTLKSSSSFEVSTPSGLLKWQIRSDGNGRRSWTDDSGTIVAREGDKDGNLEVLVPGTELVLDCFLSGWLTEVLKPGDSGELVASGLEILAHLMGA